MHANNNVKISVLENGLKSKLSFARAANGSFLCSLEILDKHGKVIKQMTPNPNDLGLFEIKTYDAAKTYLENMVDQKLVDNSQLEWVRNNFWEYKYYGNERVIDSEDKKYY